MGKRQQRSKKGLLKKQLKNHKPFVSVCTPTFNRRPFIQSMIQCYLHQDYPHDKMEWIIIDDGTDPIGDLVQDVSGVNYIRYEEKLTLGKKRNLMHEASKGDIIVYMDDDDYYPPQRVSHAVDMLVKSKRALCAGSSELHIWFNDTQEMIQFGPYGESHATAGTFAFKRELLKQTSYEETACLAEERHFLKDYTVPFVQLNPRQTILVFSHEHNTFDKRKLLKNKDGKYVRDSTYTVEDFIKESELRDFYTNTIKEALENYDLGKPEHKPDVLQQTKELEEEREKKMREMNKNAPIMVRDKDGTSRELTNSEIVELLERYKNQIQESTVMMSSLNHRINEQNKTINLLQSQVTELQEKNEALHEKYEPEQENIELTFSEIINFNDNNDNNEIEKDAVDTHHDATETTDHTVEEQTDSESSSSNV